MRVRTNVGQGRICPLELRVKKGKKITSRLTGNGNRGSLVMRGGGGLLCFWENLFGDIS